MPRSDLRYRFRGSIPPPTGRQPIRAYVEPADNGDGTATIRLYDPIDSWGSDWGVSAKEMAQALDELDSGVQEIRLHINSPGGEVFEGIAITNALRNHPARVVAVVDGLAASAASFIAAAADELVMGRNAELMIHDAWGICMGNAADMRELAGRLDHLSNNIASIYQAKAGGTVEDWRAAMLAETWYSADEAVAAGLADRVEGAEPPAQNAFDLSAFTYAGRRQAPPPTMPRPANQADTETQERAARHARRRHQMTAHRHSLPA